MTEKAKRERRKREIRLAETFQKGMNNATRRLRCIRELEKVLTKRDSTVHGRAVRVSGMEDICPICHQPVKIGYACGDYFTYCSDGCPSPGCCHASEGSTRMSWRDWAEWYKRNCRERPDVLNKAFLLACRLVEDTLDCPAADCGISWPECSGEAEVCGAGEKWECWKKYFVERAQTENVCRVCGCTDDHACRGGCYWVEHDLCSECMDAAQGGMKIERPD